MTLIYAWYWSEQDDKMIDELPFCFPRPSSTAGCQHRQTPHHHHRKPFEDNMVKTSLICVTNYHGDHQKLFEEKNMVKTVLICVRDFYNWDHQQPFEDNMVKTILICVKNNSNWDHKQPFEDNMVKTILISMKQIIMETTSMYLRTPQYGQIKNL